MSPSEFNNKKSTKEGGESLRDGVVAFETKLEELRGELLVRLPPRDQHGHAHIPWDDLKHAIEILEVKK